MQYKTGTVSVTNGSPLVTAESTAMNWSTIAAGSIFSISGSDVPYIVAVPPVQVNLSGTLYWRLTLTSNYGGATNTGLAYFIAQDFDPFGFGIPLIKTTDTNTPTIFSRAMLLIATLLNARQTVVAAPASSSAVGIAGQRAWDATYEYRCVATNTWQRWTRSTY